MNRHLFLWRATRRVIQGATALALVLLSIGFVAGPPVARAAALVPGGQDWPTYLHDVQRASASGETILSTANAAQLAKKWSFQTGGVIASSATVVAGVVYIA